jgi:hypothetical protein
MAQTKKRRRRKHRGTQGGSIDTSARRGPRPRSRAEAKAQARGQMARKKKQGARGPSQPRRLAEPTWRSAVNSAAVGAILFFVLLLLFKQSIGPAIGIAGVMFLIYVPMSYTINRFFYNRRMLREQRARQGNGRS